jgi:hypothetical protein
MASGRTLRSALVVESNEALGWAAHIGDKERIGHLLARPIGRPPNEVRRSYANFT